MNYLCAFSNVDKMLGKCNIMPHALGKEFYCRNARLLRYTERYGSAFLDETARAVILLFMFPG